MKKLYFLFIALCFFATTKAQIVNIPDANFKAKLLAATSTNTIAKNLAGNYFKIDANNDGQIQVSEALQVSYLDIVYSNVASIIGISSFSNLQFLSCVWNTIPNIDLSGLKYLQTLWAWECRISSFNFSGCNSLNYIDCGKNSITNLDVSNLTSLTTLKCSGNYNSLNINLIGTNNLSDLEVNSSMIANLNLTGLSKLQTLICPGNQLKSLDVSNLTNLTFLDCRVNQISFLDVTNLIYLQELIFYNNNLTSINVNNLTKLTNFWGDSNKLTFLDLTNCINLLSLSCSYNQLTTLMMKNGINEASNYISGNPNLNYICCDEFEKSEIKIIANPNCEINSYCSFVPGGTYYNIQGNSKFDHNADGCDVLDYNYSNLKFRVINGSIDTFSIPNGSGFYNIPVQAGTYTITPKLENPTYFNVSPTTVSVTFPTQTSPFVQNYCITANGVHPDLEITLLPLQPARPGFDSNYKIVYKNKGNQTQSGSVNLNFNDAVLDLVAANPATTTQTLNNLSWDFINLLPFETREITFTLNVNSPMETPSVNNDDVLNFTTSFTSVATDETPADNTFTLNQIVVGSFDPNDKTCLEGTIITPDLIGEYVHYMIRFENSGTANAQNIVVKDIIDLSKFDISTLVPTNASHSFVTNITAGNKVEFIFENINLPFDDANNDGYIAFKIKTLPTLKVGDTFTNDANIYFDYNFPIVTNKATSTFKTLGTQDFEFSTYFTVYPNPAKSDLNITAKETIEVQSISIYNTLGQLVLVVTNAEKVSKIDVSNLTAGNYFIKINSDKGTSNARFVKE